jgi:poly(A) polymerase
MNGNAGSLAEDARKARLPASFSLRALARDDVFLEELLGFLASLHPGMYLVGGYLRDYFLGTVSDDVDFIVRGDPAAVAARVAEKYRGKFFRLKGEEFTCRVVIDEAGRRRTVDLSPLRGFGIETDLSLRDFTVNAMAVEVDRLVAEGAILLPRDLVDKHYGWRDLSQGILRECHNETFLSDPVRLVRALRFHHVLGMRFEERTLNHLKKYAFLVARVPGERTAAELLETLRHEGTSRVFADMASTGLMQHLFPELVETVGLEQNSYHHLDVWSHTLLTLDELDGLLRAPEGVYPDHADVMAERMVRRLQDLYPRAAFLRLAALYHDAGKAETFSRDEKGRIHFHGHQERSREAVLRLSERLRLSRRARDYLAATVGRHMDIGLSCKEDVSPRRLRRMVARLGEELPDVVLLSTADRFATRGPLTTEESLARYVEVCRALLREYRREEELPPLLRGRDLLEELGMRQGPMVGEILREVRAAQMEGRVRSREEALELAGKLLASGSCAPRAEEGGHASYGCFPREDGEGERGP